MVTELPTAADLPERILDREQWVCWREQERSGKITKVPVNPYTGSFASTTDPDSWASFEMAREYAQDGRVDGVGVVFSPDGPFVGVDLDDCRVPATGTLTDEATDVVERLASYTEVSPSGTGVHVICRGKLPGDRNRRKWIEIYEEARFFTVTGDHVDGTPVTIERRTNEIHAVQQEYVLAATKRPPGGDGTATQATDGDAEAVADESTVDSTGEGATPTDRPANDLDDEEVIERAKSAANGQKFARLWRGQTSGYESHSEADMALCALLAFWTGGDRTQVDRLFRESGLMREKWDERHYADGSTYGEKTLDRVVADLDDVYQPDSSASNASGAQRSTNASRETTAETHTLRREVETLSTREEEHLELIAELQAQVERLEAANEHLAAEIRRREPPTNDDASNDESGTPLVAKVQDWFADDE